MRRAMEPEERFRALFTEAYPVLRRYAYHRGVTASDADDLVAEVLTVAWRRLDEVPADDPIPWLVSVARNVWRNGLRSAQRRWALTARLPRPAVQPPPSEPDEPGRLSAGLATLPEDDQELLRLVAWDGLTAAQVAAVLGCTPGAARVRLHRARTRLAATLDVTPVPAGTQSFRPTTTEEDA
ncbi:MAG: sigma-70 family RNA polymerase sigma factor [Actinomycetota bacterium]|nr:sigma-70 family RNA polymerase sigma factor [Actinomycetota bacterium]